MEATQHVPAAGARTAELEPPLPASSSAERGPSARQRLRNLRAGASTGAALSLSAATLPLGTAPGTTPTTPRPRAPDARAALSRARGPPPAPGPPTAPAPLKPRSAPPFAGSTTERRPQRGSPTASPTAAAAPRASGSRRGLATPPPQLPPPASSTSSAAVAATAVAATPQPVAGVGFSHVSASEARAASSPTPTEASPGLRTANTTTRRRIALLQSLAVVGHAVTRQTLAARASAGVLSCSGDGGSGGDGGGGDGAGGDGDGDGGSEVLVNGYLRRHTREGTTFRKPAFYNKDNDISATRAAFPDDDSWLEVLREHRNAGTQFTDPDFPPTDESLYGAQGPGGGGKASLSDEHKEQLAVATQWRRAADIFHRDEHVCISFHDDDAAVAKGPSGFNLVSPEAFEESAAARVESAVGEGDSESDTRRLREDGVERAARDFVANALAPGGGGSAKSAGPAGAAGAGDGTSASRGHAAAAAAGAPRGSVASHKRHAMWERMVQRCLPMQYRCADRVHMRWQHKEGFVSVVHVYMQLSFDPPPEPSGARGSVKLFDRPGPGMPFVHPGDVSQGRLADCWMLGALSTVADNEKLLLDCWPDVPSDLWVPDTAGTCPPNEQQYNREGVYAVRFWRDGAWRVVVVDDWIPCDKDGRPVFAQPPKDSCEIWSMVAEKAYAKLNGGFARLIGGLECLAMQDLTGGLPMTHYVGGERIEDRWKGDAGGEELWAFVNRTLLEGALLSTSADEDEGGIMKRHAYGVLDAVELDFGGGAAGADSGAGSVDAGGGGGVAHTRTWRLLKLRNPWGGGKEWDGDWCDSDPRWAEVPDATKISIGWSDASDGCWWMSLDDYRRVFTRLEICEMLSRPAWTVHRVVGEWWGASASGVRNAFLSPQFHLYLGHGATVFVEVSQPSRRPRGSETYDVAIAPLVASGATPGRRLVELRDNMLTPSVFNSERSAAVRLELEGSSKPYAIIPCTLDPRSHSRFVLSVYTHGTSRLEALRDDKLPMCAYEGCRSKVLTSEYRVFRDEVTTPPGAGDAGDGAAAGARDASADVAEPARVHESCVAAYMLATARRCAHCGEAVVEVTGKFSGRFYDYTPQDRAPDATAGEASSSGVEGDTEDSATATLRVHMECWDAFNTARAPKCEHCTEPILRVEGRFNGRFFKLPDDTGGGKVHAECFDDYRTARADRCAHCDGPVTKVEGKYDGRYFAVPASAAASGIGSASAGSGAGLPFGERASAGADDSGEAKTLKVHSECWEAYSIARADKCDHCGEPVAKIEGTFDGRFYTIGEGATAVKVHGECYEEFQRAHADKCEQCGEAVMGRFYTVHVDGVGGDGDGDGTSCASKDRKQGKVHDGCWEPYRLGRADKCAHCGKGILGKYFSVTRADTERGAADSASGSAGKTKVHDSCYDDWLRATADKCAHCAEPVMPVEGKFDGRYYPVEGVGKVHSECWSDYQAAAATA